MSPYLGFSKRVIGRFEMEDIMSIIRKAIQDAKALSRAERVKLYNSVSKELGFLVEDICADPACSPQLLSCNEIHANDYNPNVVASPEIDLLEQSMRVDGITMPIVTMREEDGGYVVIDGFHRHTVAAERLGREYLPCSVIDRPLADRMASTIRHNRARGKHQVDLMAVLVKGMMRLGWDDEKIANSLGMSPEEMLRLRQMTGAAKMLASDEYSKSWGGI
jgi:ParB-like chromosome segregation protein Spo0J